MRHHTAVELPEGGWHYASASRRGGHPLGYCADHPPHETEDEARRCFRQFQRDNVEPHGTWSWGDCMVREPRCPNPANKGWTIKHDGYALAILCDDHNDREHALVALHLDDDIAGDAWVS